MKRHKLTFQLKFRSIGLQTLWLLSALIAPFTTISSAQAVALPKDWCGRLWGIYSIDGSNATIGWDNPTSGASNSTPPANVTAIPSIPTGATSNGAALGYAALGLHARSGTFYAVDRSSGIIYQYNMTTGGSWTTTPQSSTGIPVFTNLPTNTGNATTNANNNAQNNATNFNKATVSGNTLYFASSDSLRVFAYTINPATGTITTPGTSTTYTWAGSTPGGNPPGTTNINGGDITQDEYGDTYNVTYDLAAANVTPQYAYFYKKVGNTWSYRGRAQKGGSNTEQFTGAAFYNDTFYVKGTGGQLYSLPLTRPVGATEYTWPASVTLTAVGTAGAGIIDLATCGLPAIDVTKNQQVYADAAATILTPNQTRIGTKQYIKYTIVAQNKGDAWARGTLINDALPAGTTYIPNSATINGTNLNAATYPFNPYDATSPGSAVGEIRLPFNSNSDTVIFTYLVQVTGSVASVQNQANISYTNPFPSDPPNCATGLNCGTSPLVPLFPSIFGTIWNDLNGSAAGTFSNIFTTGELGTNTGVANAMNALLLNSAGNVILSTPIASDGTYSFSALDTNQSNLTLRLSTTVGTVGSAAPTASIPTGWKSTSPKATAAFNLGTTDLTNQDFGIALPASIILVKRITGIKPAGSTTWIRTNNPIDNTALNTVVHNPADTANNDINPNWPTGYVVGAYNAGAIQPGDQLEYTVYYLSAKGADTKNLNICDPIRGRQSYVAGSMQLQPGGSSTLITLTDAVNLTVDRANSYVAGAAPANCNAGATTAVGTDQGGVTISITGTGASNQPDLTALPSATSPGSPPTSYGLFRFATQVNP